MDAHYNHVMNKRNQIQSNASQYYFAYSSILDQSAFQVWAEEHSYQFFKLPQGKVAYLKDTELIFDFPSRWWGGLVASLGEKKGSQVYGVLFEIPEKEWPIVQHKEGFITNMCIEKTVQVTLDNQLISATAFITNPERAITQGPLSKRFIETLISGAEQSKLPQIYIEELKVKLNKI